MTTNPNSIRRGRSLPPLLRAMRPYQWPKNLIVFAALAFSAGDAWTPGDAGSWWPLLSKTAFLWAIWSLVASATYLINDLRDRDADRLHPRKSARPIASGAVNSATAWTTAVILLAIGLPLAFLLDATAGFILSGYVAVMVAYSYGLKHVPVLDIIILCSGVIGRAVAGATAIDVEISPWLYVCSSFGAFFFAVSKRWAEFRQLGPEAARHRPSIAGYNGEMLNQMITISASGALLSYALYTIESVNVPANGAMALTVPFAGFALLRYLLLLNGERRTDAPDQILFTDPQIILAGIGFVAVAIIVLVLERT